MTSIIIPFLLIIMNTFDRIYQGRAEFTTAWDVLYDFAESEGENAHKSTYRAHNLTISRVRVESHTHEVNPW